MNELLHRNTQRALEQQEAAEARFGKSRRQTFKPDVYVKARPICACCGREYGKRDLQVVERRYNVGEIIPAYDGARPLVEESISVGGGMGRDHGPGCAVWRTTWDGSYVGAYMPFCTMRCALAFARAAYRAGHRIKESAP